MNEKSARHPSFYFNGGQTAHLDITHVFSGRAIAARLSLRDKVKARENEGDVIHISAAMMFYDLNFGVNVGL